MGALCIILIKVNFLEDGMSIKILTFCPKVNQVSLCPLPMDQSVNCSATFLPLVCLFDATFPDKMEMDKSSETEKALNLMLLNFFFMLHDCISNPKFEVGIGGWDIAVTSMTMILFGGIWKTLGFWTSKIFECCK